MKHEIGYVIEKKENMYFTRKANMLEIIGNLYLEEALKNPDAKTEHMDEIILIAHYAKKGKFTKAEEIIQSFIRR